VFDTQLTVCGNVVADPIRRETRNGHAVTSFRIASTSRRYDSEAGRYVDSSTLWVNVTCWRSLAENVAASIRKGQPVVVTGRYTCREYTTPNDELRMNYDLEATSVGHDLSRGTTQFARTVRPAAALSTRIGADGLPEQAGDEWLAGTGELAEDRTLAVAG
jgi:single-strand DNA-binding protein